ncbi:MAG TPA: antitoxin family protein [Candidatus Brocadiales bacterium]|nr:antitoxin family protein [Candidatus Brocadiales bacterium]
MTKTVNAIYEHGVFRPLEPIEGIKENTEVEVTVTVKREISHPILRFAGILSEEDANRMMEMVEDEFERVNPDEWKD